MVFSILLKGGWGGGGNFEVTRVLLPLTNSVVSFATSRAEVTKRSLGTGAGTGTGTGSAA